MEGILIYILRNILPVFFVGDHFINNLGDQSFRIFYNYSKSAGITAQNPLDQVFI